MKKVICENNSNNNFSLIINKEYDVVDEDKTSYKLRNDVGNYVWYDKEYFEKVEEMKDLNIIDASNMPLGTKFRILYPNKSIDNWTCMVTKSGTGNVLSWINNDESIGGTQNIINAIFIPIQKPVSFNEVVDSDRRCRVEHKNVTDILENKDITFDKHIIAESFRSMQKNEYITFDEVMLVISRYLGSTLLKQVITEGKWYLED